MPADRKAVEHTLTHRTKLRHTWEGKRDHDVYTLVLSGYQFGWTRISRGSKYQTLNDSLLKMIARQVNLQLAEFKMAIQCEINWPEYSRILRQKLPAFEDKIPLE